MNPDTLVVSPSRPSNTIYISKVNDIQTTTTFDYTTGAKLRGPLDISPDEVLYLAWRQKQSPLFSEEKLQKMWTERKQNEVERKDSNL